MQTLDHVLWVVTGAGFERCSSPDTNVDSLDVAQLHIVGTFMKGREKPLMVAADQMSTGPTGV